MRPHTDETVNGVAVNRQSVLFTKDLDDASIGSGRPCGARKLSRLRKGWVL